MSRFSWLIRNGIPWEHRFPCDSLALPRHAVTKADVTISPELPVLLCERKYRSATAPCGKGAIEASERKGGAVCPSLEIFAFGLKCLAVAQQI